MAEPSLRWFRMNAGGMDIEIKEVSEQVAAVALPDEDSGHVIRAAAVARAGQALDAGKLRAFCAERLPAYMIPLSIALLAGCSAACSSTWSSPRRCIRRSF